VNGNVLSSLEGELPFTLAGEPSYRRAVLATGLYGERCSPVRMRAKRLEGRTVTSVSNADVI
jgi:hypothetical protein